MLIEFCIIRSIFGAIFDFFLLQAGDVPEPVKSFSLVSIILIALGLALTVIIVVGLPFYLNYRSQVLEKEKSHSNEDGKSASGNG